MTEVDFWLACTLVLLLVGFPFLIGLRDLALDLTGFLLFWPWRLFAPGARTNEHKPLALLAMAVYAFLAYACCIMLTRS